MLAVRGKPGQTDRVPLAHFTGINVPDALLVVPGIGVVGSVHPDSCRIVIDGNVHHSAGSQLNTGGGPAASSKVVHDDFIKKADPSAHGFSLLGFIPIGVGFGPVFGPGKPGH